MNKFWQVSIVCCLTVVVSTSNIGDNRQNINLSNDGGYTDILIAISERVPEDPAIIINLQTYFTRASEVLYNATKKQVYFKAITILVPPDWTNNPSWPEPTDKEKYEKARILVAEANRAYGNVPYALQPGGCGEEGDYIHFTPEYLTQNISDGLPFTPAKTIVKEFSHLRWGLFDETIPVSDKLTSRFYSSDTKIQVVGCVEEVKYVLKDPDVCNSSASDGGILSPPCDFIAESVGGAASMLSFEYLDEVTDFCSNEYNGTPTHNKKPRNLQNKVCDELSAWEVMNARPDFFINTNTNRSHLASPKPVFRIVHKPTPMSVTTTAAIPFNQTDITTTGRPSNNSTTDQIECQQDIVCLCLDVSGSMMSHNRIGIMSESVKIYLSTYLRNNTAVGIVSFSGSAYLHADMTEISSNADRNYLTYQVPYQTVGSTNIGAGLFECQRILRNYAGSAINNTRIVLLSDGEGSIGHSISAIVLDGIILDTILYGQGGYLTNRSSETGGLQFYARDEYGEEDLNQFFIESASRGCEAKDSSAVVSNGMVTIKRGERIYTDKIYFDVTIGKDTKLVFKYSADVDVSVGNDQNLTVSVEKNTLLKIIVVTIQDVERYLDYTIEKLGDVNTEVTVLVSVSSSPVPGIDPIVINSRFSSNDVQFNPYINLVAYISVFQGMTPVLDLTVKVVFEQPSGTLLEVLCNDDGTGKDSVPNDGVYTGLIPAHKIDGSGNGNYFGLKIDISGEGELPDQEVTNSRRKRCADCNSLGNITRSATGGVIVIRNWYPVEDITPPERITDLTVFDATDDNVFTLGWTAPGDDLNLGAVSGYEFAVSNNVSTQSQVTLPLEAILSDVSTYIVEAGARLQLEINASVITPDIFGLDQSATISTYYFRMRTFDAKNNFANWSNPASATIVDPIFLTALFTTTTQSTTTVTTEATTTSEVRTTTTADITSTTTAEVTVTDQDPPIVVRKPIFLASLGTFGFFLLVVIVGLIIILKRQAIQPKKPSRQTPKQDVEGVVNEAYM